MLITHIVGRIADKETKSHQKKCNASLPKVRWPQPLTPAHNSPLRRYGHGVMYVRQSFIVLVMGYNCIISMYGVGQGRKCG